MNTLKCDMPECAEKVTHVDEKGFIYCAPHGVNRKIFCRCRKLSAKEIRTLLSGKCISYER